MAIVSVEMKHDGWKGTIKTKGENSYDVNYLVQVDSDSDGADTVLGAKGIPEIGDPYKAGNDENQNITVQSKTATPLDRKAWVVAVKYAKPKSEKQEDPDKEKDPKEKDPVYWQPTLTLSLSKQKRAAQCGVYVGKTTGLKNGHSRFDKVNVAHGFKVFLTEQDHAIPSHENDQKLGLANAVALTNSAGTAFDPPPEVDYSRIVFRYTRNHSDFPVDDMAKYLDTVNRDTFRIKNVEAFDLQINPYEAKMASVTGQYNIVDNDHGHFEFWAVTYEFHVDKIYGWRLDILDRGFHRTNQVNEDGSHRSLATAKNKPLTSVMTDPDTGHTLQEPVRLDGNAEMLQVDGEDRAAVFMRYAVYPEINWQPLDF